MKTTHEVCIKVEQLNGLLLPKPDIRTGSSLDTGLGKRLDDESQALIGKDLMELVVEVPNDDFDDGDLQRLRTEIHNYFRYRAQRMRSHRSVTIRRGWDSVKVGAVFLILLLCAAELIGYVEGRLSDVVSEGLTVLAWVALWRPTEELVYDWYPYTREIARYQKLMNIPVTVRSR